MSPYLVAESVHAKQSGIVFLCCYYYLVLAVHSFKCGIYLLYIRCRELMMVGKGHWGDILRIGLEVSIICLGEAIPVRSNTCVSAVSVSNFLSGPQYTGFRSS